MGNIRSMLQIFEDGDTSGVAYKNKALKRAIVRFIDEHGNATVTDISQYLNYSVPKSASLINDLMEDGLIAEYGKIDSTGGRRASLYGLVAGAVFFLGVDVRKYHINLGLLDFKRNMVKLEEHIPFQLANTADSYASLVDIIKNFISKANTETGAILAAGVNLSGRVNHQSGHSYSFFHFHEAPLSQILSRDLGITVFLENDSRAMAYGEFFGGGMPEVSNALFLNLDYGVGMGILADGQMYYGKSGFSGEVGHIPLFSNEIICHCGKKGCLETEASGWALQRQFRQSVAQGKSTSLVQKDTDIERITLQDIVNGAVSEDVLCIELVAELAEKLGRGVAFLINVFNPELVVMGGLLAKAGDYLRLPLRSTINKLSLSLVNNDTQLRTSKLGETAGVTGGALLARKKLLSSEAG